uniref:Aminotransferase-like plant mobile domain-containing protein n=1 Tax=Fagus sylvatica TaxID=28930 RepID=A0A2N9G9Q9_FAGSY
MAGETSGPGPSEQEIRMVALERKFDELLSFVQLIAKRNTEDENQRKEDDKDTSEAEPEGHSNTNATPPRPPTPPKPEGKDSQLDSKIDSLEEKIRLIQGLNSFGNTDFSSMSWFPNMTVPPKFKAPEFEKYNGRGDPMIHLQMYCRKMAPYADNEPLLIQTFQDTLTGNAAEWYSQLKKISHWKELADTFLAQYGFNSQIAPDRFDLQRMEKKSNETVDTGGKFLYFFFKRGRARGARHDRARRVMVARLACTPPETAVCTSSVLARHIAGKLSTSSFQRYEVCVNRSSDERVMAPGSRGIGAVFVHLSGEDSDQMGDAFGKPRVPRRSWSRYLSNAPGLVDQLVASRKDSAREGGCPGGKTQATGVFLVRLRAVFRSGFRLDLIKSWRSESSTSCMSVSSFQRTRACGSTCCESGRLCAQAWQRRWEDSGNFSTALFRQPVFTRMVDIAPDVGFRQSWYRRKAGATYFPKELLMIRKLHVVAEVNLLPKGLGSFDHNFLVSRPFWARQSIESKLSLRSSEWSGSGQFDSVFGLVNSQVKPWSNLVNLGRVWSKLSNLREMYPEPRFEGFWARWTPVGLGNGSVKPWSNFGQPWSNLVNPGQTLGNVSWTSSLGVFDATRLRWIIRAGSGSPRHACRHSRKSCGTPIDDQFSPTRSTGPALFRLGTRVSPAMQKDFDLSWKFFQIVGENWGLKLVKPQLDNHTRFGNSSKRSGKNWDSTLSRIAIGPGLGILSKRSGTNWDLTLSRIAIGPGLGILSKRSGTNWDLTLSRIAIGPGLGILSKRSGTNWDLTLSRIAIGPGLGILSKRSGTNWDLTLSRIAIGPGLGILSKRSGTNWDLTLSRIAIGPGLGILSKRSGTNWDLTFPSFFLMSDRGSGSGGHRRSDRLAKAKGKAVAYAPESSPDTDDEYDAMEDVRTRVDASLARDLQAEFDAEAAGLSSSTARPSSRPGITIGRSARPSSAPRQPTAAPPAAPPARSKRRKSDRDPLSADPIPEDHVVPGFRYPPQGGIRPRYPVTTPVADTLLLTDLHNHPSSSDPPESIGRGGWSEFSQLLDIARPEYRAFLVELGFGPFLSIRYVHVRHPLVRCWVERFFHHTGTIHLSTCEVGVLPVDWSAILGIRFGGRIPPSDPVSDFEALEILGIDDPAAIVGKKLFYLKISYLKDLLVREIEEPPTELRYRQWTAYFIFSCFLGNDKSSIPTPIVGMFRDIDALRDYDWGALTYGFYIRGLRRFSRRETTSFLGFWQFTLFWAFEHFAVFAPSRLPAAPDSAFPLARRWDSAWIQRLTTRTLMECRTTVDCIRDVDIVFQPYSTLLLERPEVAMPLSLWILLG